MGRNERHVVPNPDDRWDVREPGADRSSSHFDRQSEAIDRAREILRRDGEGEAVIRKPADGSATQNTVSPGDDPFPPRDKR